MKIIMESDSLEEGHLAQLGGIREGFLEEMGKFAGGKRDCASDRGRSLCKGPVSDRTARNRTARMM